VPVAVESAPLNNASIPIPTSPSAEPTKPSLGSHAIYQGGYYAISSAVTRLLSDYLHSKGYSQVNQIIASQATHLAMQLACSQNLMETLTAGIPGFMLQYTGASKTKVLLATSAAYVGVMLHKYYTQPDECLITAANLAAEVAGSLIGDQLTHIAFQRFVGKQKSTNARPMMRRDPIQLRPRNEQGKVYKIK
jgi:hypothetical protein